MRIHAIAHVPFEGLGLVGEWATARGHTTTQSLALSEEYPPLDEVDLLVVLGGPMGAGETDRYPWLVTEKRYLQAAIASTRVFGICLGAQLVAEVAGGSVYRAEHREVGWYPVRTTDTAWRDPVFGRFPDGLIVGHWHSDTFSPPGITMPTLSSDACINQGFSLNAGRVVGLQFHLEWTYESLGELVVHCADDLSEAGPYVMSAEELLKQAKERVPACQGALVGMLDALSRVAVGRESA